MKHKLIFLFILTLCLGMLPVLSFADSPPATLTIDGVFFSEFPSVQEAVDAIGANSGTDFVIEIAAGTVTDELQIIQQPLKNVVIRPQAGATVTFTNAIKIDGNGNYYHPETLLLEGLNFDLTSGAPQECIYFIKIPPDRPGNCYPHNITINGCTFKGVYGYTVAVQSVGGGSRNIAIMNCTANDMHSLAQLKAVGGYALIQNCVLSNSAGGVNYYGEEGNLVVDSCKLDVTNYAVRSGQDNSDPVVDTGSVTINNSILNSTSPTIGSVVLRGGSTSNIYILHSNITNADPAGSVLQNLNEGYEDDYNIKLVESNLASEQITGIDLQAIDTIDDPNVPNGPVNITGNGPDTTQIFLIAFLAVVIVVLLIIIFAILGGQEA
jgi:hypothetical protein